MRRLPPVLTSPPRALKVARRSFLLGMGAMVAACDKIESGPATQKTLEKGEAVTKAVQRAITGRYTLAQEFTDADISKNLKANGTTEPNDDDYDALAQNNFADWRLQIGGKVANPMSLSLEELRAQPARTQITRHDCVEGWSGIAKWTGAKLGPLLDQAKPLPDAKFVMFYCADSMEVTLDGSDTHYYESIDLEGAYHPQTILAYEMNGQPLGIDHGAPLRLRFERQLGYKMAKYIMRIELVPDFSQIRGGKGGYWEDLGYEWYAGI